MKIAWASFSIFVCVTQIAGATTRYVDASPHTPISPYTSWTTAATNIQYAISAASFADTILVNDGVYKYGTIINVSGNTRVFTMNKHLTMQSVNGPEVTIIQGSTNALTSVVRCVFLTDGSVLSGFTLTNGVTDLGGGGVYCDKPSCIVTNCIIVGNYGRNINNGGGARGGILLNCLLTNNAADLDGGGAYSNTLINCTLVSNRADNGGGAYACVLTNCLLVANTATYLGGGGAAWSALENCTVSNNATTGNGGGLYICSASDSLISSNRSGSAGRGGGAYLTDSTTVLNRCVLQNNYSPSDGGGACGNTYAPGGLLTNCIIVGNTTGSSAQGGGAANVVLNNCLVTGNSARYGAGVASSLGNNCTVVGNLAIGTGYGAGAYSATLNNSIIYFNQAITNADLFNCALTNCCTPSLAYPAIVNSFTNDPLFNDPNGDFHLQWNSPCINAGNNSFATFTNDLDGNPRTVGGTVDVGAYEFQWPASLISYAWLQQYNLPADGSDDFSDDDGDGINTWQEWIAGTDPTDATSLLQMDSALRTNNASATISWQSVAGKNYFIQRSADLSAFVTIQTNITGQASTTSYTDGTATNATRFFYRVGVQ